MKKLTITQSKLITRLLPAMNTNSYFSYLFDSDISDSEHENEEIKPLSTYIPVRVHVKKSKRFRRHYGPVEIVDGIQVRRNMGAQKWRRVENGLILIWCSF